MTNSGSLLRFRERMAIRWMVYTGLLAVLFWGWRIGIHDFAEPLQVAVVGHDAPWHTTPTKQHIINVGTDRRSNDLVLYDRKASTSHFTLLRRGGGKRWWARLENRSHEREISIHREGTPRINVNRYRLRHGDRFLLPVFAKKGQSTRPKDSCSPTDVLAWLRGLRHPAKPRKNAAPTLVSVTVEQRRQPFRIMQKRAQMQWGKGQTKRQLWLDESQRYQLPKSIGGGYLAYRYKRWQRFSKGRWRPLQEAIRWGKPVRTVELVRKPQISFAPEYWIGLSDSPCRWPLRPKAIPAGVDLGEIARLSFVRRRLMLQHLGQHPTPLQIVPTKGTPRHLGTATLFSGDYLTAGQLTYKVHIKRDRVRLLITRRPQRYVFPFGFFADWPSEHLLMRRRLPPKGKLLLTGGEGADTQAARWHIPLSLSGTPGQTQIPSPYRPFLSVSHSPKAWQLKAEGRAQVYLAKADGTLTPKRVTKRHRIEPGKQLYYVKRLYLRVFSPHYSGLAWRIGLLWVLIVGGMLLFLGRLLTQGKIPFSPTPSALPWTPPPGSEEQPHREPPHVPLWRWLPAISLLPIALFLNGLGLYLLATLALSSQALNFSGFLYRQFVSSLLGVWLFLLVFAWPHRGRERLWSRLAELPWLGGVLRWLSGRYRQWRPIKPQGVQVMGIDQTPPFSWLRFAAIGGVTLFASGMIAWAFQSLTAGAPLLVLFGFGALLRWEWRRNYHHPKRRKSLRTFFLTLILLGLVPIIGIVLPPLVHNRFFLKVPLLGTVKLSEFAIFSAIFFFASYLGLELFALRRVKASRANAKKEEAESQGVDTQEAITEENIATEPAQTAIPTLTAEAGRRKLQWERIGGALTVALLYLFLLGAIGLLYTAQGDLGPGLILTLCFSLYLLFAFVGSGADRLTTWGNLMRIAVVFGGLLMLIGTPSLLAAMFPDWAASSEQLQKAQERIALWNQPWRFIVGEQILQNLWNLARHNGAFQWFNNLHSDFAITAVVGVLSPGWAYLMIALSCVFPWAALNAARLYWHPISSYDSPELLDKKERDTIRSLLLLFGGIYLFAQNFIHIGSALRLTPMTGVTFTWVSSGGTSLIVCYLILAMMYRQMRIPPEEKSDSALVKPLDNRVP